MKSFLPRQLAVEQNCQQERIGGSDGGGFGRRGGSAVDAIEQDDRHHQRREGPHAGAREFPQGDSPAFREIASPRHETDQTHLGEAHDQTGNDAAEEEKADRRIGYDGVDDHGDRRRNDRPDGRRRGRNGRGKTRRDATLLDHHLRNELAGTGGIRDRGAGHSGEDDADENVHLGKSAAKAPDERLAEFEKAIGDTAGIHDVGSENEERHRKQHERIVEPVENLLAEEAHVATGNEQVADGGDEHGECHWHADERETEKRHQCQDEYGTHSSISCLVLSSASQAGLIRRLMRMIASTTTATMKSAKIE